MLTPECTTMTEYSRSTERTNNMGEDYKARIEVVLNNEDHADMCLNGETTTLQNLAIGVMAQTIALGMDSWDDAKRCWQKLRLLSRWRWKRRGKTRRQTTPQPPTRA